MDGGVGVDDPPVEPELLPKPDDCPNDDCPNEDCPNELPLGFAPAGCPI